MSSGQPRVWSFWIFDRHCSLIYHADWSGKTAGAISASASLPLNEQAKLVYGLIFSLRNMTRKLSPLKSEATGNASNEETFHSYSTSTYTLAHLQTPTNYTFVMFTDPVNPPTRRAPAAGTMGVSTFSGGGGIPSTGGMTTTGVLSQISKGPWVEFVARNPACLSLERLDGNDDDDDDEQDNDSAVEINAQKKASKARLLEQRKLGIGKTVNSEAFHLAIERVLQQNKLSIQRS